MTLILKNTLIHREPMVSLSKALCHDREALLQLILELCRPRTLNRIERCPTYPARAATADLKDRVQLFRDSIASNPYDISNALAVLYESATDRGHRKSLGQYFTPAYVAKQAIAHLALKDTERVLDPGCGTGIFPITILRELTKRSKDPDSFGYIGVENDPILALSTAISLDWVNAPVNWRVLYANFLLMKPKDLPKIDAIVANPPFIRFHRLNGREELMEDLAKSEKRALSPFSGLHSYFLTHSAELLGRGRMVFIIPMEMNRTQYGMKLLKQLRNKFTFTSKIIYIDEKRQTWCAAKLHQLTLDEHTQISQAWNLMVFRPISRNEDRETPSKTGKSKRRETVPLHSIASVHRGISTGANDFFVLTDESVREIGVPKDYLKRVIPTRIRKARLGEVFRKKDWNDLREEGKACWLLCLPGETPTDDLPAGLKHYIKRGVREGIHLVPTCKNRKPYWYCIKPPKHTPDLVYTYISRGYPKFIFNRIGAYNLTNLLSIHLKVQSAPSRNLTAKMVDLTKLLNNELRKWIDAESVCRRYKGGLVKFEPGDLKNMPICESAVDKLGIGFKSLDFHLKKDRN